MLELLQHGIWAKAAQRKGRGPTVAAISYVNADHLRLRAADTLICDASDNRITSAATSAAVLARMHKKGVKLFHLPNLHAKVVRLQAHVLVGSANMTENSLNLKEAAVLSDEPALVSQVDDYLRSLHALKRLQVIDEKFLARILQIQVVAGGGGAVQRKPRDDEDAQPRYWIAQARPLSDRSARRAVDLLKTVPEAEEAADAAFMQWGLRDKRAPLVRRNDFIVCVDKNEARADRPARVTGVFEFKEAKLLVHTFDSDTPTGSISWERLKRVLQATGAFSRTTGIPRLLKLDPQTAERVCALYRPAR